MPAKEPKSSQKNTDQEGDIHIIKEMYDSWEIEVLIKKSEGTEDFLPKILKKAKKFLIKKYSIDDQLIRYKKMTGNRKVTEGLFVSLIMERVSISKMPSRITIQSMLSEDGIPYNEMGCFGDLKLQDEFGNILSAERLAAMTLKKGVKQEFINMQAIADTITKLTKEGKPLENCLLAEGTFPDPGTNAVVEFYFHVSPDDDNFYEYLNSRKIDSGFLLCTKTPARPGTKKGMTVLGREIPPGKGLDVSLIAGKNVSLSTNGAQLVSEIDGLALLSREERPLVTPSGIKLVPSKIEISVDTIKTYEASEIEGGLSTSGSIAILGTLSAGSVIMSGGEVHIDGDVSENAFIQATHNVFVNGMVWKGGISSGKNIITTGKVIDGELSAGEKIIVKGNINNSLVTAKEVSAAKINGGNIVAGNQVIADAVGADIEGNIASICIGMKEFYEKKIRDNEKLIDKITNSLSQLTAIFGEEIIREIREDNLQQMLFKFISLKKGQVSADKSKKVMESHRKLLLGIVPLRTILFEKIEDNKRIKSLAERITSDKKMLIVKEKLTAKAMISINNSDKLLRPQPGPLELNETELMDLEGIYEV